MPEEKKEKTEAERNAEARKNLEAAFNQLRGEVKAKLDAKPADASPPPAKKTFTPAELRKAVNDGQITEDQMLATLIKQAKEEAVADADKKIKDAVEGATRKGKIEAQIDSYLDANPDLKNKESDLFQKVAAKFAELVNERGYPRDLATELTATELVLGPPKAARGRKRDLETHEETGGSGPGAGERGGSDEDGWAKGIPARHKANYERLMSKGLYTGPDDPRLKKEVARLRKAH